jgi:hypothetical protein
MRNGAAFGEGVYLSADLRVARRYRRVSLFWHLDDLVLYTSFTQNNES